MILYAIEGQWHNWAGRSPAGERACRPTKEIEAAPVIWEFFATHPKAL